MPFWRFKCTTELIDSLPESQVARKKQLIVAALDAALKLDDPSMKFYTMARFARRLADLGETASARNVVEEIRPLAKPRDARTLATVLGRIDLEAALALIPKNGAERTRNDILGTIAEAVAATDPAEAERLLGQFTHDSSPVFAVHACHRMAPVDLRRARRIAAAIKTDCLRGYAFARMADALAASDRAAALELLEESHKAFAEAAREGYGGIWQAGSAAVMAASLLPVVAHVAPDRLDEFLWRAVSLRWLPRTVNDSTTSFPDSSRFSVMEQDAALALFLSRYDRDLARSILGPVLDQLLVPPLTGDAVPLKWRLILMAAAQVDPRRAVEMIPTLPDPKEGRDESIRAAAPYYVARALAEDLEQVLADARIEIPALEILLRESR